MLGEWFAEEMARSELVCCRNELLSEEMEAATRKYAEPVTGYLVVSHQV